MLNIYEIPSYYISFNKNKELESYLESKGFKEVSFFKAKDGRLFDKDYLYKNNIITIRTYNDLNSIREQHSGIPSLGGIGCTLSHSELWKKCIDDNLPYITIFEDDVTSIKDLTKDELLQIERNLLKENSVLISSDLKKNGQLNWFHGLEFYIISQGACRKLLERLYPIDVQTDYYLAHLHNIGIINISSIGSISSQKLHKSTIQDICIKCLFPTNKFFYLILFLIITLNFILMILFFYKKC